AVAGAAPARLRSLVPDVDARAAPARAAARMPCLQARRAPADDRARARARRGDAARLARARGDAAGPPAYPPPRAPLPHPNPPLPRRLPPLPPPCRLARRRAAPPGRHDSLLRTDRMATIVEPGTDRLRLEAAELAKHYGVTVAVCPPRRAQRKGVVEASIRYLGRSWWRTARVATPA